MNELEEFLKSHPGWFFETSGVQGQCSWECSLRSPYPESKLTYVWNKPSLQEAICDAIEQVKVGEK